MNRSLRCLIFLASLVFSLPVMASSSAVAANVAQVARAFNAAIAWQTESMVLRERKLIEGEREDIQAMLAAGVYSKQHAEELLEEKEADYQRALDSLRWSNGFNAVMGAVEEQTLPYNSKHEKMASWGGAVTGLGAISEENIGKWRKTRLVLLLAELLLGFVQSWIGAKFNDPRVDEDTLTSFIKVSDRSLRIFSTGRRLLRLLSHYLVAGGKGKQARVSYLLQGLGIIASLLKKDAMLRELPLLTRLAVRNGFPLGPDEYGRLGTILPVVRKIKITDLNAEQKRLKEENNCAICIDGTPDCFPSSESGEAVCNHTFCYPCLTAWTHTKNTEEQPFGLGCRPKPACPFCKAVYEHVVRVV